MQNQSENNLQDTLSEIFMRPSNETKMTRFEGNQAPCGGGCESGSCKPGLVE